MSWYDIASDPAQPTSSRVLAGIGCGALPWVCLFQESREAGASVAEGLEERAAEGTGVMEELRDTIEVAGDAAAAPARAGADVLMWGAIALGVVLLLVLLGMLVWYVLLPLGLGGPRG